MQRSHSWVGRTLAQSLLIVTIGSSSGVANTVYDLLSFSSLQNGYLLSGTITTDGQLGTLAYNDILDVSLTSVTNGVSTYQDLHASDVYGSTNLFATATQLFLPVSLDAFPVPHFIIGSGGYDTAEIQYDYVQNSPGITTLSYYGSVDHPTTLTFLWQNNGTNLLGLTGQPWLIAQTVPEPSTLWLLGSGVMMLFLIRRRK
jgi:hypothetical protein